jgi:hypothetical protein
MQDRHRAPVLIVGAHRSGTTATARALELLGLQIGQHLDSHREPYGLQRLHEDYLRRGGATWYEPRPFLDLISTAEGLRDCRDYLCKNLRENFAKTFGYRNNFKGLWLQMRLKRGAPWGWKEPRTTLFLPVWLDIFRDARVLHVTRDPAAAAASIQRRELKFQSAGDAPSGKIGNLDYCVALVESYIEAAERFAGSANYRTVQFEDIQANPNKALAEIGRSAGLDFTAGELVKAAATIRPAGAGPTCA